MKGFGEISAEDDANLKRYFVRTPAFEAILSGERQVVVGRKGAGKTALYLALIERAKSMPASAAGLKFQDYPWKLHYQYETTTGDHYERYVHSWKFLAYIEIFKALLADPNRSSFTKTEQEALDAVEQFIKKNWGTVAFDYKKMFPSGGFNVDALKVAPQAAGFGLGGVDITRKGGLGETIIRLNEWLWSNLQVAGLASSTPVYVLFDELDSGFDATAKEYPDRVIGLLIAVRVLAREFRAIELPFRPVAFLRSDIFDTLHFGDKNKLADNNVVHLRWNDSLVYQDSSLKELIDHRIKEELQLPEGSNYWSAAFDGQVMRGTQHKFAHIASRGYLRPRDVIKFCNCALKEAKLRIKADATAEHRIINSDLRKSRRAYSQYLLKELDDEIAPSYPTWQQELELLRRIGFEKFSFAQASEAYKQVAAEVGLTLKLEQALEMFYRYSIIGVERTGRTGEGSGYYYHFRYMDESIRLEPGARSYMVHRGLKQALELAEKNKQTREDGEDSEDDD
jgi:hypothetical protein